MKLDTKAPTAVAERKRNQRQREREQLMFEREDWRLFTDLSTLPQKAGCHPQDIGRVVLRELTDNALDIGKNATISQVDDAWVISDDGPGIDPARVPELFCVNRPLRSSKLKRLPLRGMLGNGLRVVMGYVAATESKITIETRGRRMTLSVDSTTGKTKVIADDPISPRLGTIVKLALAKGVAPRRLMALIFGSSGGLGTETDDDNDPSTFLATDDVDNVIDVGDLARASIEIAKHGEHYSGPSSPWWYGEKDLHQLFMHAPPTVTVGDVCDDLGLNHDDGRLSVNLSRDDAEDLLKSLRASVKPVHPESIGYIGHQFRPDYPGYALLSIVAKTKSGAEIPYVVEAWARCERSDQKGNGTVKIHSIVNRTPIIAQIHGAYGTPDPKHISMDGCGFHRNVAVKGAANFSIFLSVITPYIQLASDGKEPVLAPCSELIAQVVKKACGTAYRAMDRPERGMSIKEAAWSVMVEAYQNASGDGVSPANARQVMYAARPQILAMTGIAKLDGKYFTKTLLPKYLEEHPQETENWDVVFDDRGHLIEPHTGKEIGLGTISVRDYLAESPQIGPAVALSYSKLFPTAGPANRYSAILFIEKEGFMPLLQAAKIEQNFDIGLMSTKGTSVIAARRLLDGLDIKVLVLHDFDVKGFEIFHTLGTTNWRYKFKNKVQLLDIGLRLTDVEELGLESEPVTIEDDKEAISGTLKKHGATDKEIDFLLDGQRVELNMMTSPVFIAFLQRKFAQHGIKKVIPDAETLEHHARRVIEQVEAEKVLQKSLAKIRKHSRDALLPDDLAKRINDILQHEPAMSWDQALNRIVRKDLNSEMSQ